MPTTALVRDVAFMTPRTRLIRLHHSEGTFAFRAGQALWTSLPASTTRVPYSIASAPSLARDGSIELLVPAVGAFGNAGLDAMRMPGQTVYIEGPVGNFGVPPDASTVPLLLVGGGTGIAPLRSVVLDRLERAHTPMTLVYSARTPEEFAFDEELSALASRGHLRVLKTVTRDTHGNGWQGRSGRIDRGLLADALPGPDAACLVCGPSSFVDDVVAGLHGLGVPAARIVVER